MPKILFDSHSHISDEAYRMARDNDPEGLSEEEYYERFIRSIEDSDIKYCMDIGVSVDVCRDCIESSQKYDFCYATVGLHPSEIEGVSDDMLYECLQAFNDYDKVVAVGEIGLDYHYDDGPDKALQQEFFKKQLQWAIENNAPVCIHTRDADDDTMRILKESGIFSKKRAESFQKRADGSDDVRVLLHCFSGSLEMAKQYVAFGCDISLAGPVTFKNARKAVEVAEWIPVDRLLIETDSPYMSPEPKRGTRNTPVNVQYVAKKIAEIKGIRYEEAAEITFNNACRFYGIKQSEISEE